MYTAPITVTVSQARKLSGLGMTKLWQMIATGQLQAVRVGRRRLVVYSSLEKLLRPADRVTGHAAQSGTSVGNQDT